MTTRQHIQELKTIINLTVQKIYTVYFLKYKPQSLAVLSIYNIIMYTFIIYTLGLLRAHVKRYLRSLIGPLPMTVHEAQHLVRYSAYRHRFNVCTRLQ